MWEQDIHFVGYVEGVGASKLEESKKLARKDGFGSMDGTKELF